MLRKPISYRNNYKKITKSVHMEEWIWELLETLDPSRSLSVRRMILKEIKSELTKEGIIIEGKIMTKKHGALYIEKIKNQME